MLPCASHVEDRDPGQMRVQGSERSWERNKLQGLSREVCFAVKSPLQTAAVGPCIWGLGCPAEGCGVDVQLGLWVLPTDVFSWQPLMQGPPMRVL